MFKVIWEKYKVELAISVTLAVVIIATNIFKNPVTIAWLSLGSIFGTFLLDLDYIIYAYFLEPEKPYSKTLKQFGRHKDYKNFVHYLFYNKEAVKEKTLNSVLFQIALAGASILVVSTGTNIFIKTFVLSSFANSIYKMLTHYFDHQLEEWFWSLKNIPTKNTIIIYTLVLVGILIYTINIF